eukprot:11162739-Lingulodinium_polyedra.AAC.1
MRTPTAYCSMILKSGSPASCRSAPSKRTWTGCRASPGCGSAASPWSESRVSKRARTRLVTSDGKGSAVTFPQARRERRRVGGSPVVASRLSMAARSSSARKAVEPPAGRLR